MNEQQIIHILCNELIPIYDDLEQETKNVINEHAKHCRACEKSIQRGEVILKKEENLLNGKEEKILLKPFKSLILFKRVIAVFFILVRGIVLGLLALNWLSNYSSEQISLLNANMILFYLPLVVIINVINLLYFRNRWFWITLAADILILIFFDNLFA